jgi:ribose transport system substrate-binding protein
MKTRKILVIAVAVIFMLVGTAAVFAGGDAEGGAKGDMPKKIGYVTNYAMHEWYQNVMKGMRDRAAQLGIEIEIIDANLDMAKEVSAAEDLMAKGVDVLIITPVDQKGAEPILRKAKAEGIPVVIEASAVEGMQTLVAICDYDAGYKGGVETGKMFKKKFNGTQARVMNMDLPALRPCILRCDGFMDGFKSVYANVVEIHRLDGSGVKDLALQVATDALTADPNINVIYGCNDDSALGALQAYRAAGLDEDKLIVCGTGGEGNAFIHALEERGAYMVESCMFPENVGFECVDMAVKLFRGEDVPNHYVTATQAVTVDTYTKYYTLEGDVRTINWDTVTKIKTEAECGKY